MATGKHGALRSASSRNSVVTMKCQNVAVRGYCDNLECYRVRCPNFKIISDFFLSEKFKAGKG